MLIMKINNTIMQHDERWGGREQQEKHRIYNQGLVLSVLHFYLWMSVCKSYFLYELLFSNLLA